VNGVHDLGGMMNFGPVVPEREEPAFHAPWERRAFALTLAMGATGRWNLDQSRDARERMAPADYLASSYYRIWIGGLERLLLERALITHDELVDGRTRSPPAPEVRVLAADRVAATLARGAPTEREATRAPRFAVGDAVRARTIHPSTHTRLPRYCRGKRGVVVRVHGAHVFPDVNVRGHGEDPQWLYTVRFDAVELWGDDTTASAVCVDCWEPYLETG
jgi:nitrile hydratase beta subunit